jgi:curli production assembly/transport component CsgG/holdfast attachment protein HfaB
VVSYQKQIIGRQVGLGLYSFFGSDVIDVSAGEGGLEPIQMAVRAMIERASVEIMANLYGAPGPSACINPANDPYAPTSTTGLTGGFYPAYNNLDQNNANTRDAPNRWNSDRDKSAAALRDRY